jgi:phosphate transport system substrate-binding protein
MKKKIGNMRFLALAGVVLSAFFFLITCKNKGPYVMPDSPTSGNIRILADESIQPIVKAEVSAFTSVYRNAHITPAFKPEKELISDFLNDSVDVIVSSWSPSEEMKKLLLNSQVVTKTVLVAYDALALVLNRENADTLLTYEDVKNIFIGKINNWKQINPKSELGEIKVIFDNDKSANIRYFKEKFLLPEQLPSNFFAVKSNPEVISYISESPGAIGILSVNWISDSDDSASVAYSKRVRIAAVSTEFIDKNTFYKPAQGSIYDKSYPFVRETNIVSREASYGLGSGFIAWVSGEQGQRIILKSGLVPATMPVRLVRVSKK